MEADAIKKLAKTKQLVMGTETVLKKLKNGKISKVFLSSNCSPKINRDIGRYAKLSNAEVVQLNYPNDELGVICKKPFSISVLGLMK